MSSVKYPLIEEVAPGAIETNELADGAVTGPKIDHIGDDVLLHLNTAKSRYMKWSTVHGGLLIDIDYFVSPTYMEFYSNTAVDGSGAWEPAISLKSTGVLELSARGGASQIILLRVGDSILLGSTPNHVKILPTGQLSLVGTAKVWKTVRLPLESFRKGVTAPTDTIKNNNAGLLFDADAEAITIQVCVPNDWDAASDLTLQLFCLLNAAETANDLIDWESTVTSLADHETCVGAPTQTPGAAHDIVADNADGTLHMVELTIDYDNATCPVAAGDEVNITISRTANVGAAGYVAGVILVDACTKYRADKLGEAV